MSDITSQVHPSPAPLDRDAPGAGIEFTPAFPRPRPRVWPAVLIVALQWLAILGPQWLDSAPFVAFMSVFVAPIAAAVLMVVWCLCFSRMRWADRLLILGVIAVGGVASQLLVPYPWMAFVITALPWATTVWAGFMALSFFLSWPVRRGLVVAAVTLTWAFFPLIKFDGVNGNFKSSFTWRWLPTAEEKSKAELAARKPAQPAAAETLTLAPGDWPGFRGADRDGRRTGVRIATDWNAHPPQQVWRQHVGPGWGSFAVVGNRLYTQEQRDQDEMVVCYNADNGEEIWEHKDHSRFYEDLAKAGPRATPTFHDGRIYTLGGKGLLNCLDAATGEVKWMHDIVADSGAAVPQWGFSASPLVLKNIVTVFAGGPNGKGVLGYDAVTGELVWYAGEGKLGYSSTHAAHLAGGDQVLIADDVGLTAFDPAHGDTLWKHSWPLPGMGRVVQPALLDGDDVLLAGQMGTRRLHVAHDNNTWTTDETWTAAAINPFFDDQVVYDGHVYGFDGAKLMCSSLEDGAVKWKQRKDYGGQILLLADQGVLLILWEQGAASLVEANPKAFKELGRFQALTEMTWNHPEGKTWNHPAVAHGKLFVRNGEEMACYKLAEEVTAASK